MKRAKLGALTGIVVIVAYANAQNTTIEVPQGSGVFPTIGQVNCLEELGSGLLCAATYQYADGESGELWGDMANHDGRRPIGADSPVATKRGCSIEVLGKASVRWLSGYRPSGRDGVLVGLTSSADALRPVYRAPRSTTTEDGNVLDYVLDRYDTTLVELIDDECGHIREGHQDRKHCEEGHLRNAKQTMYLGLSPFARCVVELAEAHIRHHYPDANVGGALLDPRSYYASLATLLSDPHVLQNGRAEYRRAGAEEKLDECWNLHLDDLSDRGIERPP